MYDSRTHKPVRPGTHRYASKAWRDDLDWPGETDRPTLTVAEAIAEDLADHVDLEDARECEDYSTYAEPLTPWEQAILDEWDAEAVLVGVDVDEAAPAAEVVWASDDAEAYAEYRADWDEGEDGEVAYYGDPYDYDEDLDDDDSPWLPTLSYEQACEELAYGFTVEGPSARPEPLREGHYVRVYQLARDLGVDSGPLVRFLRNAGEYVASHQSWVALPVAGRLMAERDAIALALGERTTPATGAQRFEALLRNEAERARVSRPPMPRLFPPRPDNNPFAQSSYAPNLFAR